ncbi:camphor resistance protein CrcB [Nocardia tenerifensis]|uniref:Fluoride-specific ion channel FluC n=1 Tax=Nocardia tenerifensis TaxID=228006 RepID=A0A318JPL5_9NOCA|nr:fluoride efflux transporter CrcB [Nocardia tenerifensis]PXX54740.1 camphor resistance protein CrcB [Nocardia tenerifensis]
MNTLLVILGAAVGAPLRYLIDRAVQLRHDSRFPWGTLLINASGSLLLGALLGADLSTPWISLAATGFCGAFTTYSTFTYETIRLAEQSAYRPALLNITTSVTTALIAASIGYATTQTLHG